MSSVHTLCTHCRRWRTGPKKGKCFACYNYEKTHGGRKRPVTREGITRGSRLDVYQAEACKHCRRSTKRFKSPLVAGLCVTCRGAKRRLGTLSGYVPITLAKREPCVNCEREPPFPHRKGLCPPCYTYWKKIGIARPSRLWVKERRKAADPEKLKGTAHA
jgi:hypothetical protein